MSEPTTVKRMRMDNNVEFAHPDTSVDLCKKLLHSTEDYDVFFIVGPEKERIGAHTLILKNRSSVFEVMFSPRWKEGLAREANEIVLEEDEPSVFRSFLEYVYADSFNPTPVQAVKLLHLAQYYDVKPLVKLCGEALAKNMTPDEVIQVLLTSRKYKLTQTLSSSILSIVYHFAHFGNSPAFHRFDEATLILFLRRDDLCVVESELFSILLKWADKKIESSVLNPKPERKDVLRNLIPLVRFPVMTPKEFASVVVPTNLLSQETVISLFMYFNADEEKRIEIGKNLPYVKTRRRGMPIRVDLYKGSVRPGLGVYRETSLKKRSNARDILTFKFSFGGRIPGKAYTTKIVSLVLQGALEGEALFKNSSKVRKMFPIKVAVSLCLATSYSTWHPLHQSQGHQMFPLNEEVIVNVGKEEMEVQLDKPWEISSDKLYKITLRFLSDVYTVPKGFDDGSGVGKKRRDEKLDVFTTTVLQDKIDQKISSGTLEFLQISIGSATADPIAGVSLGQAYNLPRVPKAVSTGLHLLRALKIQHS